MTTPLMMLGPGGDYVTRFDVKGNSLIKSQARAATGYDADAESSGNSSAWGRLIRRPRKADEPARRSQAADQFLPSQPAALPATYARPVAGDPQQQLAMHLAIEHWLSVQASAIQQLAGEQIWIERELERAAAVSGPDLRIIRWNGGTMKLPTPRPTIPAPSPCHTFSAEFTTEAADTFTTQGQPQPHPERIDHDVQPQPHAQTVEDSYADSRHPALARLFADHAGTRRGHRRLQGHYLRARRGADQKGLPDPRPQQGALFGAVA